MNNYTTTKGSDYMEIVKTYGQTIEKLSEKNPDRAQELLKIDYIETKTYHTADEKKVVNNIVSTKEEKMKFLTELINKSYTEGTAVYLFNTYQLTDANYQKEIESLQRKMFGNIFYGKQYSADYHVWWFGGIPFLRFCRKVYR